MDKEQTAIARLQAASEMSLQVYKEPLVVTTSGGKDSSVCVALAQRAGIPFEVLHNHTTADAPETVYFIRDELKRLEERGIKCTIEYPTHKGKRASMWSIIPDSGSPPTMIQRYCCRILKEKGGVGRFITTGVRWAESSRRKKTRGIYEVNPARSKDKIILNNDNDDRRRLFETCTLQAKRTCNPIIDWEDTDVWDYLTSEKMPVNPLYKCGYSRVGCVGCPMANKKRAREFARYPKYKEMYIRAFDRMLMERARKGKRDLAEIWGTTGIDVFHWWMMDGVLPGQINFDDLAELMEEDDDLSSSVSFSHSKKQNTAKRRTKRAERAEDSRTRHPSRPRPHSSARTQEAGAAAAVVGMKNNETDRRVRAAETLPPPRHPGGGVFRTASHPLL